MNNTLDISYISMSVVEAPELPRTAAIRILAITKKILIASRTNNNKRQNVTTAIIEGMRFGCHSYRQIKFSYFSIISL